MPQIHEADWLKVGFYWMALAVAASAPGMFLIARTVIILTLAIHVVEAFYSLKLSARLGAPRRQWFWRTLLLGIFSLRRLRAENGLSVIRPK